MHIKKTVLLSAILLISGCGHHKEHRRVKAYHLQDNRWCFQDSNTKKWYWLEKIGDIDLSDVTSSDYYRAPTLPARVPAGYAWTPARPANQPPEEEIQQIEENQPGQIQEEEISVDEQGDPSPDGSQGDGDSGGSGESGGDSGGGDSGGGGDGGE